MDTLSMQDLVAETYQELREHGLADWKVVISNGKRVAGHCNYQRKEIALSRVLMPRASYAEQREVVLHEIAHALTPGHSHDAVWRAKLIEMGGTGKRTHQIEAPQGRYEIHCETHGVIGHRHALQGTMKRMLHRSDVVFYTHKGCGGRMFAVDTKATAQDRLFAAVAAGKATDEVIADALKLLACKCGCGGTTKGGNYLPGHDARHVSQVFAWWLNSVVDLDGARAELPTEALREKLTKRVAAHAEKNYK